jgi:hypothetical protein
VAALRAATESAPPAASELAISIGRWVRNKNPLHYSQGKVGQVRGFVVPKLGPQETLAVVVWEGGDTGNFPFGRLEVLPAPEPAPPSLAPLPSEPTIVDSVVESALVELPPNPESGEGDTTGTAAFEFAPPSLAVPIGGSSVV